MTVDSERPGCAKVPVGVEKRLVVRVGGHPGFVTAPVRAAEVVRGRCWAEQRGIGFAGARLGLPGAAEVFRH